MWIKDRRVSVACTDLQSWTFSCSFFPTFFPKGNAFSQFRVGKEIYNPHLLQNMLAKHSFQDKTLKLLCRIRKTTCISYDEFFLSSPLAVPTYPFLSQGLLLFKLLLTTIYLHNWKQNTHAERHQKSEMSHQFFYWYSLATGPLILLQFFPIFHVLLMETLALLGFLVCSQLLHEAQL